MRRMFVLVALLVLTFGAARAAPFTGLFEGIAQEVADRTAALPDDLDKAQKKQAKALGKGVKALAKASDSEGVDLTIAG